MRVQYGKLRTFLNKSPDFLKGLDQREIFILQTKLGLFGCKQHTLQEIGDELKISRERVRQIQNEALNKILENAGKRLSALKQVVGSLEVLIKLEAEQQRIKEN